MMFGNAICWIFFDLECFARIFPFANVDGLDTKRALTALETTQENQSCRTGVDMVFERVDNSDRTWRSRMGARGSNAALSRQRKYHGASGPFCYSGS